ncbi:MAG: aminopeptidase P family protein [Caldilineaceae bacterium]|nr:aminopeptidase P family protein [Caldilineaceae bacterium]
MQYRIDRLRAALAERDLPGLLVGAPANRRYLSDFTASYGWMVVTAADAFILTDSRYLIQAGREAPDYDVRQIVNPGKTMPEVLAELCKELGLDRLAFEAAHTTVADHSRLVAVLGDAVALEATEGLVEGLRMVKDEAEMVRLRRAISMTDAAMEAVAPRLCPDHTERQAVWMLEQALRERGAEGVSFPIIVAAGPNAALPHHRPGDDPLGKGGTIIIDMGALLDGYHADLTRTLVIGEPDKRFRQVYDTVAEAQRLAIAGIRPGALAHEVDALARDSIAAAGYGAHFGHGLGHGIGLNVHEEPFLRWALPGGTSAPLQAGMVTSVEPGIYLEGWGGVRIEDIVLVTADGCEVLSNAIKLR